MKRSLKFSNGRKRGYFYWIMMTPWCALRNNHNVARPNEAVEEVLKLLPPDPKNKAVPTSDRDKLLRSWFDDQNLSALTASTVYGWGTGPGMENDQVSDQRLDAQSSAPSWRWYIGPLPRAFVEDKESPLAWRCSVVDHEMASIMAKELVGGP